MQTIVPNILNSFILTNIPKVRTRGVELDAVAQITPELHFDVGYAYTGRLRSRLPGGPVL